MIGVSSQDNLEMADREFIGYGVPCGFAPGSVSLLDG